jgi:3-hydroxyisobutyrate dehydrogenase-like beta-hydroxyacid dehydrogenase
MRLGFVGAGRIGLPMIGRLTGAGHQVTALARRPAVHATLLAAGAAPVSTLAEVAAGVEAVLLCVHTDAQVREVAAVLVDVIPAGSTLVVHTTGSPQTVETLADVGAPRGVTVVDAPVSGGPKDVAAGAVTLFVGGADEVVARVAPVLGAYADPLLHLGPLGAGQRAKLVNNAVFAANLTLIADAVSLGERFGLPETSVLTALSHGSAASRALAIIAAAGGVETGAGALREFLGKDIQTVHSVAAGLKDDLGLLGQVLASAPAALFLGGHK